MKTNLLAPITTKATLVVGVAQSCHNFTFNETITCSALGAKRLLVALGAVVAGTLLRSVRKETTL